MPTITPIAGPAAIQSGSSPSANQMAARAKAIAMISGQAAAQTAPVPDPTHVSAEEAGAIKAPSSTETPSGQEVTNDAPAAPQEVTAPEEAPLSSQYAQLARREKQFRAQQNAVKAHEAAVKAREEAVKAKEAEMQGNYVPKDRVAKDTLRVLQEAGLTSDQITQMLLNAPDPAAQQQQAVIEKLEAKIKALEDGQDQAKKTYQENQSQQYTQAVNTIRLETKQLVSTDPAYETIKATNSIDDVVELITKTFQQDGTLLTVEEAATAVEDYLVEEAMKLAQLSKIQARLKPAAASAGAAAQPGQKQPPKTLTNQMGTSAKLSARERAMLAFKGELK